MLRTRVNFLLHSSRLWLQHRLQGTVTAFKHRRGYGFILAEGVLDAGKARAATKSGESADSGAAAAAALEGVGSEYFFPRSSLNGGFYVSEGERVSFEISPRTAQGTAYRTVSQKSSDKEQERFNVAANIKLYDSVKKTETPITPVVLRGKVTAWDAVEGVGEVVELDTHGKFHEDGPRFALHLEDLDLSPGVELYAGRYVRFCTNGVPENDVLVAQRVIIDKRTEQKNAAYGKPLAPAGAAPGTVTDKTRFFGTVREMNTNFGFIMDDLSGESIFFHRSNAKGPIASGDKVSYLLREMVVGKHAGKKSCFQVRRATTAEAPEATGAASAKKQGGGDDDDDDFDLLD